MESCPVLSWVSQRTMLPVVGQGVSPLHGILPTRLFDGTVGLSKAVDVLVPFRMDEVRFRELILVHRKKILGVYVVDDTSCSCIERVGPCNRVGEEWCRCDGPLSILCKPLETRTCRVVEFDLHCVQVDDE